MEFSGEDYLGAIDAASAEPMKNKGGRPTVGDNFLLGSRNRWCSFFEECWPEIGWPLLQIRKRRSSAIEDVRETFSSITGMPRGGFPDVFLRASTVPVSPQELTRQKIANNKMQSELQDMRKECGLLDGSLTQAENAFTASSGNDRASILAELTSLAAVVSKTQALILAKRRECVELAAKIYSGEAYIYLSELLDFLRSGRRAVTPANLAKALAGLPDMRWRQSAARCSRMEESKRPQPAYAVFLAIKHLSDHVSAQSEQSLNDSFQTVVPKLPMEDSRNLLCEKWRDFRLAIEEVYNAKHETGSIPYVLTYAFLRNLNRSKTSVDNHLDAKEKLVLKTKSPAKTKHRVK